MEVNIIMFLNILYTVLLISIVGFLISGMMAILQFGGYFKKHKQRYIKYFITFAVITVILMGAFVVVASGL